MNQRAGCLLNFHKATGPGALYFCIFCDDYHIILQSPCSDIFHNNLYCHSPWRLRVGHTRPSVEVWPHPPATKRISNQRGPDSRLSFAMRVLAILYIFFLFHETQTTTSLFLYEKVYLSYLSRLTLPRRNLWKQSRSSRNHTINNSIYLGPWLVTLT